MSWFNGNEAEQQYTGGGHIPEGSIVKVRLEPLYNNDGSSEDDFMFPAKTGTKQMKVNLTIVSRGHEGRKWNEFWTLDPAKEKASNITRARLRAILEAARGIDPKDLSPNAQAGRQISGPQELWGLEFPIKVKYTDERDGKVYNELGSVITPDKEEYATVMAGEEIITDAPLPAAKAAAAPGAQPKWGAPAAVSQSPVTATHHASGGNPTTSSTGGKPGGAAPSWAKPKSDVPF